MPRGIRNLQRWISEQHIIKLRVCWFSAKFDYDKPDDMDAVEFLQRLDLPDGGLGDEPPLAPLLHPLRLLLLMLLERHLFEGYHLPGVSVPGLHHDAVGPLPHPPQHHVVIHFFWPLGFSIFAAASAADTATAADAAANVPVTAAPLREKC